MTLHYESDVLSVRTTDWSEPCVWYDAV